VTAGLLVALAGCDTVPDLYAGPPVPPAPPLPIPGRVRVVPRPEGRFAVDRAVFPEKERSAIQAVALGDCNGDGALDVVTLGKMARINLYVGRGGGAFEPIVSGLPTTRNYRVGTFVDLDRDGLDDLVLGDSDVAWFRGDGTCHFGPTLTIAAAEEEFAAQVLATDVNLDGLTDLSIVLRNARSAPHRLLVARGDGSFEGLAPPPTPYDPAFRTGPDFFGFGMYYDDLDGDGALDLFGMLDQRQGWFAWGTQPGGLTTRRDEPLTALFASVDPMSLSPLDFDRDGRIDWFVSGINSHSLLLWHQGGRDLRDAGDRAGVGGIGNDFAWGSYSFDADLDGWSDLLVLREGQTPGPNIPPPTGPTDLFLNRRDGTFAAADASVVDLQLRAKSLACGPSSPRGEVVCFALDLGGPVMLVNGLRPRGRQALVRLRGTVSAPDATGARVSIDGATPPQVYVVSGQAPHGGEHARTLQVALGDRDVARVTVRWPSGLVQPGVEVRADAVTTIAEPAAVTLVRRVLPADGAATTEVVVDPGVVGATCVGLSMTGVGTWADRATVEAGGRVRRVLRAPTVPGEARLIVTLDGKALRVRPRVLFTRP
jgi:hypothetical protein